MRIGGGPDILRFLCIHNNDDADYDELEDEDNPGTSPTAMAQVDAPVFDVTFRLLRKSHHLEKKGERSINSDI